MSTSPDSLQQRYGGRSRVAVVCGMVLGLAAVVAVVGGLVWLAWAMFFHADPAVSSQEIGHQVVDDHRATITVRIEYGDEPVEATCRLRAIAHDKTVVGETSYQPAAEVGDVHEIAVRTYRRATTVEWLGCTAPGQPRPR